MNKPPLSGSLEDESSGNMLSHIGARESIYSVIYSANIYRTSSTCQALLKVLGHSNEQTFILAVGGAGVGADNKQKHKVTLIAIRKEINRKLLWSYSGVRAGARL